MSITEILQSEKDIIDYEKSISCYFNKCFPSYKELALKRGEYIDKKEELSLLFSKKELTKKEYLNKMRLLDEAHFYSDYYKRFATCIMDSCYKLCEKTLNEYLEKIPNVKYKKPSKYTVDDFINIMKLFYHYNMTTKFIKLKSLRNLIIMNELTYNN